MSESGGSVGRGVWGVISDRLFKGERIIVLLIISILVAIVSVVVVRLPSGISFYIVAIIVFVFGFGSSGFNGIWMNATNEMLDRAKSGAVTGVSITFGSWGVIFFPPIFGLDRKSVV